MGENLRTVDTTGSGSRKEVEKTNIMTGTGLVRKIETHCDTCTCPKYAKLDERK